MNTTPREVNRAVPRILIVDDDPEMCRFLGQLFTDEGYEPESVHDGASALDRYRAKAFDLALTDLMMPRMKGTELVGKLREINPDAPILLITAFGTIESAVEAMRAGAFHYVTKPFRNEEILLHVRRALEQGAMRRELQQLRSELLTRNRFEDLVAKSDKMQKIFATVDRVADLTANVLIIGESGTGKELVARAIHRRSSRADKIFVPVHCAAIPETLLESEIFGYVRGAFTDARRDRAGLFREADGGVLFLDEISEIPLTLQAKLLRVIEDKEVRPLGSNQAEKVETRIVSACNRDLESLVEANRFRQDLYYRLNVIRIDLPPLRERSEDIPLLADYFVRKFSGETSRKVDGIEPEALAALLDYRWPGNVRELEHTIERAVLLGSNPTIAVEDLPPQISRRRTSPPFASALAKGYTLRDIEKEYISRVLEQTSGNKSEAAKILGVDRTTLYRKLEEYKLKE